VTISVTLNQFLTLYTWFVATILLFFLILIARYYQRFAGERTYFRWFIVPIVLFTGAAVRYASIDRIAGDSVGDILIAVSGLFVGVGAVYLYRVMTVGRE